MENKVSVLDGKYTFYTKRDDYAVFCDRYDTKEWMVFTKGHKAILALMYEAMERAVDNDD